MNGGGGIRVHLGSALGGWGVAANVDPRCQCGSQRGSASPSARIRVGDRGQGRRLAYPERGWEGGGIGIRGRGLLPLTGRRRRLC